LGGSQAPSAGHKAAIRCNDDGLQLADFPQRFGQSGDIAEIATMSAFKLNVSDCDHCH
jgi:hypothetical protein